MPDIKTSINPLIPGRFGPKKVIYSQSYDNQSRSSLLIINIMFEIANLDPKLKTWGRIGLKTATYPIFMKFNNLNKSNLLIMNILTEIDDFVPKSYVCKIWSQNVKRAPIFMKLDN